MQGPEIRRALSVGKEEKEEESPCPGETVFYSEKIWPKKKRADQLQKRGKRKKKGGPLAEKSFEHLVNETGVKETRVTRRRGEGGGGDLVVGKGRSTVLGGNRRKGG